MNKQIMACLETPDKGSHIDSVLENFQLVHPKDVIAEDVIGDQIACAKQILKNGFSYQIPSAMYRSHLSIKSLGMEKTKKQTIDSNKSLWKCARHMAEILCAYEEDLTLHAISYSNGLGELDTRFVISTEGNGKEPLLSMIRSVYSNVELEMLDAIPNHEMCLYASGKSVFCGSKEKKRDASKELEQYQSWISAILSALPAQGNYKVSLRFSPICASQKIEHYREKVNEQYRRLHFFADYNWGSTVNMGTAVNEGQHIGKTTIGMDSNSYNAGYSLNLGGRDIHKEALVLSEQLEHELSRIQLEKPIWAVQISASTDDMDTMQTLTSIISGITQAADIQLHWSQSEGSSPMILNTKELLPLLMFPTKEFCGFRFVENEAFSLVSQSDQKQGFQLGNILWNGTPFSTFYLSPKALERHAFICGMTGAGKTNTLFKIMEGIQLPFCVIEPVKGEYRALKSLYPDLKIWTMKVSDDKNSAVSILQMNPFWFPRKGNLAFHIDSLKTIITSSFELSAAMPNILEQCLYQVYVKAGWDLITNRNIYWDEVAEEYLYPTFSDLCNEIEEYLEKSDFSGDLMGDYKGALLSRIKSFVNGYKGILLNTNVHPDYHEMMQGHTIIELEGLADDADKCLVMGTIFVQYYQYLKLHFKSVSGGRNLQHILVIEEAHRLFKNTKTGKDPNGGPNPTGQLVDLLSNMMAEIRAFGEGILIVDQSPTKVAEDVIKNSATKIVHRIDNHNDIKALQSSMLLPEEVVGFASLAQGEALIRTDGMEKPCKVKMLCSSVKESYGLDASFQTFDIQTNPLADVFIANSVLNDDKISTMIEEKIIVCLDTLIAFDFHAWYEILGYLICDIQDILRSYKKYDVVDSRMSILFEIISTSLQRLFASESRKDFGKMHMFVMRMLCFFRDKKMDCFIKQGSIALLHQYMEIHIREIWKNYRLDKMEGSVYREICQNIGLDAEDTFAVSIASYATDIKVYVEETHQVPHTDNLLSGFLSHRIVFPAAEEFLRKYAEIFDNMHMWLTKE